MISCKELVLNLIEKGCIQNKSKILDIERVFNNLNLNNYKHFIRGYVDGNGCISNGKLSIHTGKKDILDKILFVLNYKDKNILKDKRSECYSVNFGLKDSYIILSYLYGNSKIYLQRKYEKFREIAVLRGNS